MRKLYALILLTLPVMLSAQQDVQFTQFMFNRLYYNPAVAGSGGAICVSGFHRSQWVGFEGAPTTQNVIANIPLNVLHGGIGLSIVNDEIGFFNNTSVELSYAYQFQLANGTLGVGLGASFLNKALDASTWIPSDQGTIFGDNDPFIAATDANGFQIDLSFGAYYESQDWWAGVSSTRVIESRAEVSSFNAAEDLASFRNARHYYLMGGYNWAIPGTNWELQPALLSKFSAGSAATFDLNAMGVYNKKVWGGVTYRLQDAIGAMVGYQITPAFRAGYSYDIPTSALSGAASGSHEIMLQYCFKIEIPPRPKGSYRNIRFL